MHEAPACAASVKHDCLHKNIILISLFVLQYALAFVYIALVVGAGAFLG